MVEFILGGLFIAVGSVLGAGIGWWVRGLGNRSSESQQSATVQQRKKPVATSSRTTAKPQPAAVAQPAPAQPAANPPKPAQPVTTPAAPVSEDVDVEAFEEVMSRIKQLTETVAADVGVHNTQIQEIGQELAESGGTEAGVLAIVEKLVKANEAMQSQLETAEERLQDQAREMESHVREARTDALTKLCNRRAFDDEMKRADEEAQKNGRATCVLMMDVDHFKKFNDTYGHQAGDEVLRGVARVLNKNLAGKEIVCRYGGEEFAVVFPGADIQAATPAAERARAAIGETVFEFEGMDLRVTASAGLAQLQPGETANDLVKRADDALYVCKEAGRNNGHWHDGQYSHPMTGTAAEAQTPADAQVETDSEPTFDSRDRIAGVSDRDSFCNDLDRRIAEYKRGGDSMSLIVIDIDKYPDLIDEYGEKAGEVVLRATAQFLKATMREMDHVARLEQSEFALLIPSARLDDANQVAERLRSAVHRCALPINGESLKFSVSIGTTEIAMNDDTMDLIGRAQSSVKVAIGRGGNCTAVTDEHGEVEVLALSS